MIIGIISGVIILALAIGCIFTAASFADKDRKTPMIIALALAIIFALSFLIVPFSWRTVNTGEVAVVRTLGEIKGTKGPGTSFAPWITTKYIKYDAKVQNLEAMTAAYSSDAQTMEIAMTIQYQIMADKVVDIATHYGTLTALQSRIQSIAIEKTKAVLSSYKAMDIIANRATISPAVEQAIMTAVGDEYYVDIVTVVLTNIDFSDAFELAVENKMIAEQTKLQAEYENQTKIAKAAADAEAKLKAAQAEIDIAKAEAEAIKIAAEAEAEANRIIEASLTDGIIEKILADSWDGELPKVVGGEGGYMLPTNILG